LKQQQQQKFVSVLHCKEDVAENSEESSWLSAWKKRQKQQTEVITAAAKVVSSPGWHPQRCSRSLLGSDSQ
jgi:hypothetical protein